MVHKTTKKRLNKLKIGSMDPYTLSELNHNELSYLLSKSLFKYHHVNRTSKKVEEDISKIIDAIHLKKQESIEKKEDEAEKLIHTDHISLSQKISDEKDSDTFEKTLDIHSYDRSTPNFIEIERQKNKCLMGVTNSVLYEIINNGVLTDNERTAIKYLFNYDLTNEQQSKVIEQIQKREYFKCDKTNYLRGKHHKNESH